MLCLEEEKIDLDEDGVLFLVKQFDCWLETKSVQVKSIRNASNEKINSNIA